MGRVYKAVCAGLLVLAVAGCTSSSNDKKDDSTPPTSTTTTATDNPLDLPQTISTAPQACEFESLIGVQYLIEAKGSQDAAATLGATLESSQTDGGVGVLRVMQQGYSAQAKAVALGNLDDLLGTVTQSVKTSCTASKNPILTDSQWQGLTHLVGADSSIVSRVKLFRPAGKPG